MFKLKYISVKKILVVTISLLLCAIVYDEEASAEEYSYKNAKLIKVVEQGNFEAVKAVLAEGADPNLKNNKDEAVLMMALENGDAEIMKLLLDNGADVNIKDDVGWTPLMNAIKRKRIDIMEMLLKAGADPNMQTKNGAWPLEEAVIENMRDAFPLLVKYGADKNALADSFAMMWLISEEKIEILNFLLDNGVPVSDNRIVEAVRNGNHKALQCFIKKGIIDLNRKYTEVWPGGIEIKEKAPGVLSINSNSDAKPVKKTKTLIEFANNPWTMKTLLILKEEKAKQEGKCTPHNANTSMAEAYVMPGENICGLSQAEWGWRYWEWLKSFPKEQNPADDPTGSICMQKQSGPVFMLAGSNQEKPVKRSGKVPADKYVFLPVLVSLGEQKQVFNSTELMRTVQDTMPKDVSSIFVEIDGKAVADMKPFRQTLGCYFIDNYDGRSFAASDGYWLMLKPIATGKHTIRFGGRFSNGFSKDVLYELMIE